MRHSRSAVRSSGRFAVLFLLSAFCLFLICAAFYLRRVSTQIAISDASDVVSLRINQVISEIMSEGEYDGDAFITLNKDDNGEITAVSCNMARINALSAEILDRVVGETENCTTTVRIPLGNLSGISLLLGRGPKVPIDIVTLTSSRVEFKNDIISAGINQTKHQITLEIRVDVDILVPWGSQSTQVVSEVLIADTVIVGKVPDSYLDINGNRNN